MMTIVYSVFNLVLPLHRLSPNLSLHALALEPGC